MTRIPLNAADGQRFWAKVDKTDGCWHWLASHDRYGYARFDVRRVAKRGQRHWIAVGAHRVAYELLVGPVPAGAEGMEIDHLCRNRGCVNPAHMEVVTHAVNTLRGTCPAAVNATKAQCDAGHEFTPENTYIRPNGNRDCRVCIRERGRQYKARKKAA